MGSGDEMREVMMRCRRFVSAVVVAAIAAAAAPSAWAQVGKPVTIVDANIASDKELAALPHLNAALVKGVLERRPFPSITELDAFLSQSLTRQQLTELYGRLF